MSSSSSESSGASGSSGDEQERINDPELDSKKRSRDEGAEKKSSKKR